jgi:hypothetical protein
MVDRDFSSLIQDRNLAIATLLDPRIKTFAFASLEPGTPGGQAREFLYQAAASVQFLSTVSLEAEPLERTSTSSIWEHLEHRKALAHDQLTPVLEARVEVDNYLKDVPMPMFVENDGVKTRNDPMVWWKTRNTSYPRLFYLAKRHLVLIMNSVACERIFSKMGLIISSRRCSLASEKACMITMVANNFDYL